MELNKIYCESNLETMARMPDNFIDLTVTSPPYDNLREYKGYSFDFESVAKELFRVTKIGGVVVWVVGDATVNGSESGTSFRQALYFMECGFKLHDTMIYARYGLPQNNLRYEQGFEYMFILSKDTPKIFNPIMKLRKYIDLREPEHRGKDDEKVKGLKVKNRVNPNHTVLYNIWRYAIGGGNITKDDCYEHPAMFPEQLAADHIHSWSNEGDLIYDPFMGSGTTAKMAHLQKRNWIGSEISSEYVDLANKRIAPYLNQLKLF